MENSINEKSNVNNIINKNIESENINKMLELIEYSIKENKQIGETETDKNEIIEIKFLNKFIKEGNIKINDNDSFESFIKELIYLFNKGSNIFVPFLNICPILIEYYIKNDIDEGSEIEYLGMMKQIHKMGSMKSIIKLIPGANKINDEQVEQSEAQLKKTEALINSMTKAERAKPSIIDPKRKRRIAAGSGTQVSDVNILLKQFDQMQKMMKQFGIGGGKLHGKKSRKNRAALLKGLGAGMNGFPEK